MQLKNFRTIVSMRRASEILGVSRMAVCLAIKRGRLPAQMASGVWLIQEADVIEYRDNKQKSGRKRKAPKEEL